MALIKPGPLVSDIRGSIGGSVFARNAGGLYVRNRVAPLNPQSTRQTQVRSNLSSLSNAWSTALTQAQRDGWNQYASQVPLFNALGEQRFVSGLAMYVRANTLLLDTGGTRRDDPPDSFTLGPSVTPTYTLDSTADTIQVDDFSGFTPSTTPINVLFTQSPAQNPGVNFLAGPFRKYAGQSFTTDPAPPTTPAVAATAAAFPFASGQAVFLRSAVVTPDGRVGPPQVQRFLAP